MNPLYTKTESDPVTAALRAEYEQASAKASAKWAEFDTARKESGIEDAMRRGQAPASAVVAKLDDLQREYEKAADEAQELHDRLLPRLGKATSGPGGSPHSIGKEFVRKVGKALDGTSGGSAVQGFYDPEIRELPQRQLLVRSLIPHRTATGDVVHFLRQTTADHNAAPVAAGALKPTSTYTIERVEQPVVTIAHLTEALDRSLLMDMDALASFIDSNLRLGVLLAEEEQILNGDGVGVNLLGILNTPGVLTQAIGTDSPADATFRAIQQVRSYFWEPDAIAIHPDSFEEIRLSKATGSGDYLTAPVTDGDYDRLWGKRVVNSPVIPAGTALVGAFADGAVAWDREEARISWAETGLGDAEGQELFTRNQIRARGEERIAFGVTFPQAFCAVDLTA